MMFLWVTAMNAQTFGKSTLSPKQPVGWENGRSGTISNLEELLWLSENTEAWDEDWTLEADIDASETIEWNDGEGFSPMGSFALTFSGSFNGNGYTISNLFINRPAETGVGLFGVVTGSISNVALLDTEVTGGDNSGSLVGELYSEDGLVECCYSTGSITGGSFTGGLIGYANNYGVVSNCYSNVNVTCSSGPRGGLIGSLMISATVQNCYSTGVVSVENGPAGGLVGMNNYSNITNSYYDLDTSGVSQGVGSGDDSGVSSLATIEFADEDNFPDWDFETVWQIAIDEAISANERPYFQWQNASGNSYDPVQNLVASVEELTVNLTWEAPETGIVSEYIIYRDGEVIGNTTALLLYDEPGEGNFNYCVEASFDTGGSSSPECISVEVSYMQTNVIYSLEDLQWLSENTDAWDQDWMLGADIDAYESINWNDGLGFSPIGDSPDYGTRQQIAFTGSFDGQGYTISNIHVNRPEEHYVGFFGLVTDCSIQNLNMTDLNVNGKKYVGGLVGYAQYDVTIENCHVDVAVSAEDERVGGLVGQTYQDININLCSSTGTVYVSVFFGGGLVGDNYCYSYITNCHSNCDVSGGEYLGGLVGTNRWFATIDLCYANGKVTSDSDIVGGLVGFNDDGVITNCYSTSYVSGASVVGGLLGQNSMSDNTSSGIYQTYASGSLNGTSLVGGLVGLSYAFVENGYFDVETCGTETGIGNSDAGAIATGLNTIDFADENNFENWDFENIWTILINCDICPEVRPHFNWQIGDYFSVSFNALEGGAIQGVATQNVMTGCNSYPVVAQAESGYVFTEWMDSNGNTVSTESTLVVENIAADEVYTAEFSSTVGTEKLDAGMNGYFYPNPAINQITIETNIPATITITDLNGRILKNQTISENTNIDVENLREGVYVFWFRTEVETKSSTLIIQ